MSIYHVTNPSSDGKGGGAALERTSFVGFKTPAEIKEMVKQLKHVDKATVRKMLQVIVRDFEGHQVTHADFRAILPDQLDEETAVCIFAGLLRLLQLALRHPSHVMKQQHFTEDLQDLKIPEEYIADISSVVFGSRRTAIHTSTLSSRPRLPQLQNFSWRVDASISTSVLNRVLEPTVLMEMKLSDGKIQTFEVPVSKFHELRFNVAHLLKEMEDVEKKGIFKIQS